MTDKLGYIIRSAIANPGKDKPLRNGLHLAYKHENDESTLAVWRIGVYPSPSEIATVQRTLRDLGYTHLHAEMRSVQQSGHALSQVAHAYHITWPDEKEQSLTT
ncbi:MAG TPA: hypothetical protein VIK33_12995 [Anaerolineae bacterium]